MEEAIKVPRKLCMKVTFPNEPKYFSAFRGLPPIFEKEMDDKVTVYCPTGYEIRRDVLHFKVREFYKFFKALKVENGRKLWRHDAIILETKKTQKVTMKIAPSELYLVKLAAERAGESLSDYVRAATLTRMVRELGV